MELGYDQDDIEDACRYYMQQDKEFATKINTILAEMQVLL